MHDVIVIGGGVVGCATARELSKYDLDILLLEKSCELSEGASKANSGIVHAGYDCEPGSLKAELNVKGNALYEKLAEELEIPFKRNSSIVLSFSDEQYSKLLLLAEKGRKNKVPDIQILDNAEVLAKEPNINPNVVNALYAPTGGIVSPYEATLAFAESAFLNGASFELEAEVLNITKESDEASPTGYYYRVSTGKGEFLTRTIVNAAGIYSDFINNLVSETKYSIKPRKGEYQLLDKTAGSLVTATVFQLPTERGKGTLVTPTVHGNILVGPSSEFIEDKASKITTAPVLSNIMETALLSVPNIPRSQVITSFTGLRANSGGNEDFIINEPEDAKGFINAVGIDSPGLSATPAIAQLISEKITALLQPKEKSSFISRREAIKIFKEQSLEEQNALIAKDKRYGQIVCRCETVTEGEIIDSITRPLGARTIDGVKRRTRSGMGRCQGGFCSSKVMEILARELNIPINEVTKFGKGSIIIMKENGDRGGQNEKS